MIKFGIAKSVELRGIPKGSIILSPFAEQALSPADRPHAMKHSLVVMDLTWSNIDDMPKMKAMNERSLPFLIASNPVNWGRPMELNSAEAVVASLMILGEKEQATEITKRFGWGEEFIRLNGEMLSDYSKAATSTDVVRIQNEYLEAMKR